MIRNELGGKENKRGKERERKGASIGVSTDPVALLIHFHTLASEKNENIKFNHNIIQLLPLVVQESGRDSRQLMPI